MLVHRQAQKGRDVLAFLPFKQLKLVDHRKGQASFLRQAFIVRTDAVPNDLIAAVRPGHDAGFGSFLRRQCGDLTEYPARFIHEMGRFHSDDGLALLMAGGRAGRRIEGGDRRAEQVGETGR